MAAGEAASRCGCSACDRASASRGVVEILVAGGAEYREVNSGGARLAVGISAPRSDHGSDAVVGERYLLATRAPPECPGMNANWLTRGAAIPGTDTLGRGGELPEGVPAPMLQWDSRSGGVGTRKVAGGFEIT